METVDIYLTVIESVICSILGLMAGAFIWINYLSPWLKSRRVAIRGKDGRR